VVTFSYDNYIWGIVPLPGDLYTDSQINIGFSSNQGQVISAINNISTQTGTNTQAGFRRAKNLMNSDGRDGAKKVIILLSDGVANVSIGNRPGDNFPTSHNVHTIAAYEEGQSCHGIADVYTIGLFGGLTGYPQTCNIARDTLQKAQNAGYYETTSAADLSEIYDEIAGHIGVPAKNAVVTDEINSNFDFVQGSIVTNPDAPATYDPDTHTITWEPGTIEESAQLTYKIRAKADFQGGDSVPTNVSAVLDYTDVNGNDNVSKTFPVPEVYVPAPLSVDGGNVSIFIGESVNLGECLTVNGGYGPYSYEWTCDTDFSWNSNEADPTVAPEKDTVYTVTVTDYYGCTKSGTVEVTVRTGTIIIKKVVSNENSSKEFIVRVEGPDGKKWNVSISDGETKRIEGLWPGEYEISETVPMDYELNNIDNANVEISSGNETATVTVTNIRSNYGWFKSYDEEDNKLTVVQFAEETPTGNGDGEETVIMQFSTDAILPDKQEEDFPGETNADDNGEDNQ